MVPVGAMRFLMVASIPMEFPAVIARATEQRRAEVGVDWARRIRMGGNELMLLANGAGAERASAAVDAAFDVFRPDALVSTGFCGALDPALAIADIVVATEVADNGRRYPAMPVINARAHRRGVVRTNSRVAQTAEERRSLRATGASVVEMEAAGVAERARIHGLPFYCVKVVTDLAGETMANDFNRALRKDGHFDTIVLLKGTLRHPFARIRELLRLQRRSVLAARALGDFIADSRF
jgi:adenosylhomocysteine nucleosidase